MSTGVKVAPDATPTPSPSTESPRKLNFANFQPTETKVCATCKRLRSMGKFSDFQFCKEFGDCLDCIYIHGKHRKEDTRPRRNTVEYRLSQLHASPRKDQHEASPRDRRHSVAYDRIIINTLEEGVKLFLSLDTDCNGTISKAELIRGMSTNEKLRECLLKSKLSKGHFNEDPYTKLFNNIDSDHNGVIDMDEFIKMLKAAHHDIYREEEEFIRQQANKSLFPVLEIPDLPLDEVQKSTSGAGDLLSKDEKKAARALKKLSSMETATKPSVDAVKRAQFKSPHRQYIEKKKEKLLKKDKNDVKDLNSWSTYNASVDSGPDPFTAQLSPRGGVGGSGRCRQMYTYQTHDGCLLMHERATDMTIHATLPNDSNDDTFGDDSVSEINSPRHVPESATPRWQEITSVDLSDVKKRDPNNFTLLSGDCSPRKKILCWKESVDVDSSSDDSDDEFEC